jgi:hypothetical protein
VCPLSAHGQTSAVTEATVATEIHQAIDIHRHFAPKITLYLVMALDDVAQPGDVTLGEIVAAYRGIDLSALDDLPGGRVTDAEDICQRDIDAFVAW